MKNSILWIIVGAVALVALFLFMSYNRLVAMNEVIDGQWAQVEVQYQRRIDLIPNLVESVKGVLAQEQEIFGQLAEARSNYAGARSVEEKVAAATQVESALARLLAIMENYPQLRSVESVTNFMTQLEGTENRISVERMRFNEAVRDYNIAVKRVPTVLVAQLFGFRERNYFVAVEEAATSPKVDLRTGS